MVRVEVGVGVTTERGRQVEAEAVDLDVVEPVAQRVEHESLRGGQREVDGVAASGHVDVVAVGHLSVVRRIVESAQRRGRPAGTLLGGVVVDDIQDDLETGFVQQLDHALELAQHGTGAAELRGAARVAACGVKKLRVL